MLRFIGSRAFRIIASPILYIGTIAYAIALGLGHTPKIKVEPGSPISPELVKLLAQIQDARRAPVKTLLTDRDRDRPQAMTWGMAGAAIVILTGIATSSKPLGPAMVIGAECLSVTIPLFIVFGLAYAHHWDPAREPPAVQETINLGALVFMADCISVVGLASVLWYFDRRVSIAFLVAFYLAWRAYKNLVAQRVSPKAAEDVAAMLKSAARDQPSQRVSDTGAPGETSEEEVATARGGEREP